MKVVVHYKYDRHLYFTQLHLNYLKFPGGYDLLWQETAKFKTQAGRRSDSIACAMNIVNYY